MELEKLLHLFDTLWFDRVVLSPETPDPPPPTPPHESSDSVGLKKICHVRSSSEQQLDLGSNTHLLSDLDSPKSVLHPTRKLETIVSGIQINDEELVKKREVVVRKVRRMKSRSLTEMEFREVKGFMDLGFVFSEADHKDSNLVSMIPGLRRHCEGDGVCGKCGRRRCERMERIPLRVDSNVVDELEMKNHIKFWAHSVASAVR